MYVCTLYVYFPEPISIARTFKRKKILNKNEIIMSTEWSKQWSRMDGHYLCLSVLPSISSWAMLGGVFGHS